MPSGPPPGIQVATIPEAIAAMRDLEASLPGGDGVACFNSMYLKVTEAVGANLADGMFADPAFMDRLDVNFANLYLGAYASFARDPEAAVCSSWRALFERRSDDRVLPLQFALAGMNAHINHDLPLAVTITSADLGRPPMTAGIREDFLAVNKILAEADDAVRAELQGEISDRLDSLAGPLDDAIAAWGIARARGAAWRQAIRLWELRDEETRYARFLRALDGVVAVAGRCLLAPVSMANMAAHHLVKTALLAVDDLADAASEAMWGDGVVNGDDDGVLGTLLWTARRFEDHLDDILRGKEEGLAQVEDGVASRILRRLKTLREDDGWWLAPPREPSPVP